MTKDTFVIRIYSVTGRRYVMKKVDELTKNRREMDRVGENISATIICVIEQFLPRIVAPVARMEWLATWCRFVKGLFFYLM
jgi:hypothetical protein